MLPMPNAPFAVAARDRAAILLRGSERTKWLNGLVTSDVGKRAPGQAQYGLVVEKKGRIVADYFVVPARDEGSFVLAVPAAKRDELITMLDHYLIMEDVELERVALTFVHVVGVATAPAGAPFFGAIDWLGVGGGACFAAPDVAAATALAAEAGLAWADDERLEALRIERGVPRFGVEVDSTLYPQEAALEQRAVAFDKGCYLGQEVVYMLEHRGHVKRKLVGLDAEEDGALAVGATVTDRASGEAVGEVRSAAIGPSGRPVAIAMVKWAFARAGSVLAVAGRTAHVRALT